MSSTQGNPQQNQIQELEERVITWLRTGESVPVVPPAIGDVSDFEMCRLEELRCLVGESLSIGTSAVPRAGFLLEGSPGRGDARVRPGLAWCLGQQIHRADPADAAQLPSHFDDLWSIDLSVWAQCRVPPPYDQRDRRLRALAVRWLRSPGRKLVLDLGYLNSESNGDRELDANSLRAAVGLGGIAGGSAVSPYWLELSRCQPSIRLKKWEPATEESPTDSPSAPDSLPGPSSYLRALDLLEGGSPFLLRGAALRWLLTRLDSAPVFQYAGVARSLKDELPLRLATAFDQWDKAEARSEMALEGACLAHASILARRHLQDVETHDLWGTARWIQQCATRSPFHGGDAEILTARLTARLPETLESGVSPDLLDPSNYGEGKIALSDLALLMATSAIDDGAGSTKTLLLPLSRQLQKVARRGLTPFECQFEAVFQAEGSTKATFAWSTPHAAPPWVARWLLTHRRVSWLDDVSSEGRQECVQVLRDAPDRYGWLGFAVQAETSVLKDDFRRDLLDVWRDKSKDPQAKPEEWAALSVGVVSLMNEADWDAALKLCVRAGGKWTPFLLDALSKEAKRLELPRWRQAMEKLVDWTEKAEGGGAPQDTGARLTAALLILQQLAPAPGATTSVAPDLRDRTRSLLTQDPFRSQPSLQREARRLGIL